MGLFCAACRQEERYFLVFSGKKPAMVAMCCQMMIPGRCCGMEGICRSHRTKPDRLELHWCSAEEQLRPTPDEDQRGWGGRSYVAA